MNEPSSPRVGERYEVRADDGAGGRIRTPDLLITNQLLYQLSYTSVSSLAILTRQNPFVNRKFSAKWVVFAETGRGAGKWG